MSVRGRGYLVVGKSLRWFVVVLVCVGLCLVCQQAQAARILLVTDNPGGGAREAPFIAMLEGELGHVVVNKAALSNYAAYNGNPGVLPDPAMYDLIIFGGCTNSSNYCDGGGTTYVKEKAWNALAKPIMTMNGGVPLTSRWGWVNTAGSATLTGVTTLDTPILNASHPFVNGRTTSLYLPGATVYPPRQPGRR